MDNERASLGTVLMKQGLTDDLFSIVSESDYIDPRNKIIATYLRAQSQNIVTLTQTLKIDGVLEQAGGAVYISELIDAVSSTSHLKDIANIIKETSTINNINDLGRELTIADGDSDDIIKDCQIRINEIADGKIKNDYSHLSDLLKERILKMESDFNSGIKNIGLQTGFEGLDKMTTGLYGGNLIVIGGRPGTGKSTLALSLLMEICTHIEGVGGGFFSLEMSKQELINKMLSYRSGVESGRLRSADLVSKDFPYLVTAVEIMNKWNVMIDDKASITLPEICSKSRQMVRKGAKLIIVDYLQLMSGQSKTQPREQFISSVSRGLKTLAKDLDVPVIALTQLNRGNEQRKDTTPRLSDIRESGAIEQDADVILFTHPENEYHKIVIAKNRHGESGEVMMKLDGARSKFTELDSLDISRVIEARNKKDKERF